jgi:predicted DNA-binding transcriptional regulator AlpA
MEELRSMAINHRSHHGDIEPRRMLNEQQVLDIVPISRATLWRMERAGKFPRGTYISPNRKIWYLDEIVAWQNTVDEFNPKRGRGGNPTGKRRRQAAGAGKRGRSPGAQAPD